MKRLTVIQLAGVFVLSLAGIPWAMPHCDMKTHSAHAEEAKVSQDTEQKALDVGNKVCPVGGEKIEEKQKATYEYEGRIYNFCCAMCIDDFKKDPQKYIKKIEQEKQKEEASGK